ncbi:NifU family protein [Mycolicibacterium sp. ND9-15]|uniref:NifU family protein n=1 Tax=Mycolicibacterium sp. ND9-15 TaxID=3042320 RepID=UPI002DDB6E79|nr:NifU family protein [Mycolicibacterium sp. ND9-15]WSE55336.1 NifU family protein [Mycolicibacterium sp. ND9-15]
MSMPTLHPEGTSDPRLIRWVTGGRQLSANCPELAALIADGTLEQVQVLPGEVHTCLGDDRSWPVDGPRVRSALLEALSSSGGADEQSDDIRRKVAEIIEREVMPVAGSHGGSVTVESVSDGVVTVDFGGACAGCTLRGRTLRILIARAVQAQYPQIREVRTTQKRRLWLKISGNRRGQ